MLGLYTNRTSCSKAKRLRESATSKARALGISISLIGNPFETGSRTNYKFRTSVRPCVSRDNSENSVTYQCYHAASLPLCSLKDSHKKLAEYETRSKRGPINRRRISFYTLLILKY